VVAASVSEEDTDDGSILISPSVYEFPPPTSYRNDDDLLTSAEETRQESDDDEDGEGKSQQFSSRMGQVETLVTRKIPTTSSAVPPHPLPKKQLASRRNDPRSFEEDSTEEEEEERGGSPIDKSRGIFSYKTKTHYVQKNIPSQHHRGPPIPHLGPAAYVPPKGPPPPPKRGWGGPPPHPHHHHHHRHPKVPHYVKYWEQNHAPHHHLPQRKKQGWKTYSKPSPFAPGYWVNLAERLADGVGLLPEYGKEEHKVGPHKHGKYHFKGITLHNGFFTEVL